MERRWCRKIQSFTFQLRSFTMIHKSKVLLTAEKDPIHLPIHPALLRKTNGAPTQKEHLIFFQLRTITLNLRAVFQPVCENSPLDAEAHGLKTPKRTSSSANGKDDTLRFPNQITSFP
ncbi:hypothetical protein ILYODFUR_026983 [Ilyodon furcidens]|uniref:Uncharacterized protein n=1 Tax=Ilyodon furcidens TaxID=33524 RepID=A0ABV0T0J3_9TELE